ncbi:MAG TPA: serine hydrolase domain-containing protein, partial [Pedobacter sp.]|uniref:serine hydrolase domain-containing protein n=1 Tax=Pedobacter sp. TaxID=1411316 RepID=UPI002CE5366A
ILGFLMIMNCAQNAAIGQSLPDSTSLKVDRLFARWNSPNTPGCVVGIIQGDKIVYGKGFGLASMEDSTLNTPSSVYYMCSVSKQFAGYAIALLANEGKINLDDDIHTYLPWMSDFGGKKIIVRNLLSHTSGIRDDIGLSQYFGLGINGMLTQDLAINILKRQHSLNFTPGEKFSYSNSNYVLLSEIVKKVSGKTFRKYVDSAIFRPLGMTSSAFIDEHSEIIRNRAYSYNLDQGVYHNANHNVYTMGDGGLFTNINDMAKWVSNFYQPKAGTQKDIDLMTTSGKLNDGKLITYAMGIDVVQHRGYKRLIHNGGLAGYRTVIAVYPELKTGFLVFGNGGDRDVYNKINELAELLIPDRSVKERQPVVQNDPVIVLKDSMDLKKWAGNYIAKNGYSVAISYKAGKLYAAGSSELAAEAPGLFHMTARTSVKYKFSIDAKTKQVRASLSSPALSKSIDMSRTQEVSFSISMLQAYAGNYVSEELECVFKIEVKENSLWISGKYNAPAKVRFAGLEHMFTESDLLSHLLIRRDAKNKITGFELSSGDTSGLVFRKI